VNIEEKVAWSKTRRRVVWTCVVLVVLLLLALLPPLLNVSRLRHRIAESMSASLGRPVHLDNVTMHLLPVPGFTLENLVVSEDPAFGSEPVIRANTVEATLRPSSLWRRQVELSSIRFEEPSVNLVRNAQGKWNLQSLLMHAASVDTAPTAQRKAGPEPRFPYIEATGSRVNLKLGEEKKPFALTDADFALWLPTPAEWRVRLEGKPARTDTNITDPGTVKLEGSLERAGGMAEVPVDLKASWEGAPLGEASKMLTGEDMGWRGNLTVEMALQGKLGAAKLTTKVHLEELRRADFVPVSSMDVRLACSGVLSVPTAVVAQPQCTLPTLGGAKAAGKIEALADSADVTNLRASALRVMLTGVDDAWLLDWARLFSQRIPAGEHPVGTLDGAVVLDATAMGETIRDGDISGDLEGSLPWDKPGAGKMVRPVSISANLSGLVLAPLGLIQTGKEPSLTLSGTLTQTGYTERLEGTATAEEIEKLRSLLPPLGDALDEALPGLGAVPTTEAKAMKVDVTCQRTWKESQTCAAAKIAEPKTRHRRR
jgi:hypothetical protein